MGVAIKYVESLGEYLDSISEISGGKNAKEDSPRPEVLWFRGMSHVKYELIPSLFRTETRVEDLLNIGDYSGLHYAEDIRAQHYIAKNYHYFDKVPQSRIEWLEVMQHHGVKTRVLDWSESSIHSLIFALERFLDDRKYKDEERKRSVPCVWVLKPQRLNKKIFEFIFENQALTDELIQELDVSIADKKRIRDQLEAFFREADFWTTVETRHMDYIMNLSTINDEVLRDRCRLKKLLTDGSIINVYYYLLSRIYSDGHILRNRLLAPLAVVQPYHSERIKAQKGVFTVFPFYQELSGDECFRKLNVNPDGMENNPMARECLCKIVLHRPQHIAYQILANGINISWLYPEMPIVSNEIENHQIY